MEPDSRRGTGAGALLVVLLLLFSGCAGSSDNPGDDAPASSSTPPPPPPYPVYNIQTKGDRLHFDGPGVYRAEVRLNKRIDQVAESHSGGMGTPGSGPQWLLLAPSGTLETANGTASCGSLWSELRVRPILAPVAGNWPSALPAGNWDVVAYIADQGTITLGFNATPQTTLLRNVSVSDEWTVQTFNPDIDAPVAPVSPYDAEFEQAFSTQTPSLFLSWFAMTPRFGTGPRVESWFDSGGTECARDENAPMNNFPGFQGQARFTNVSVALPTPGQFRWAGHAHMDVATQDPTLALGGHLLVMTPPLVTNATEPAT